MTAIMVVEDNAISARILDINLTRAGYQTLLVPTGKSALSALASGTEADLIITDIIMADMDGFRLLRELRENERWRRIPVMISSSLSDTESVRQAAVLGCRSYLIKPIQPGLLLRKIAELFSQDKPTLRDRSEAFVQFGLDEEAYLELAGTFGALVRGQIVLLEQLQSQHSALLRPALRDLSEGALVMGAERLTECIGRLQATAGDGLSRGGWVPGYKALLEELKLVEEALASPLLPV